MIDSGVDDLEDDGSQTLEIVLVEVLNTRLDKVLAGVLPDISRARLQALMAEGALTFGGEVVTDDDGNLAGEGRSQRVGVGGHPQQPTVFKATCLVRG